jgi:hypothetical protein
VAKLVPAEKPRSDVCGCMAGTAEILSNIEAPVVSVKVWKVSK